MPETFPLPTSEGRTYGDYVGYYMSGVEGLRAGVGALEQYYGTSGSRMQAVGVAQRNRANIEQQQIEEQDLTPAARELLQADIGSPSFWAHPIGWGIARTAQSAPYLFASLAPIAMSGGSGLGLAAGAVANGVFSAGDITNSWMQQVDSFSSDQLAELSPSYAEDIINGVSEDKARENLIKLGLGNKPVVATLLGIATTYLGLGGAVAGAAERVAGKSILPRMAGGVIKGALKEGGVSGVGEAIQTAGEDLAVQSAAQETGVSPSIDYGQTVKAALTGFAVGGPLGAVAGGVSGFGHGARSKTEASEAKPSTEVEPEVETEATTAAQPPPAVTQAIPTTVEAARAQAAAQAAQSAAQPSPAQAIPTTVPGQLTPNLAPFHPEQAKGSPNKTVLPDPLSPTPEQTVALQHKVTPPQVTPPQVTTPNITKPTVTPPNVTRPEVTAPQVTPPQVTRPDITRPEVTRPEVTRPQVTPPQVTPPQVTRPEVTPPNVTAPIVTTPTVSPTGPVAAPLATPEALPAATPAVGPSGRRILTLTRERTTPVKKIAGRGRVVAEKPRVAEEYVAKPAGRILEDLTAKERYPEVWAKYKEDQVIAGKRRAEDKKAPLGPVEEAKLHAEGIRTGKIGKPAKLKLEGDEQNARVLFDRLAKGSDDAAETSAETQARVKDIVKLMDDNGITPGKVTDVMANHMLWLRTAQELHKKFETGKATPSHIATFISNEREAKAGDFTSMRDRSGGETASRAHHDVELLSDEITPSRSRKAVSGESEQITDVVSRGEKTAAEQEQELQEARNAPVSKSKSKTFEKAEASEGRRIEITPELRAKYEGVSKFAEEVEPTEQLQEKVTEPEPTPEPIKELEPVVEAPKAAEIKEKVKAKKAPAKEKPAKVAKAVETAKAPKEKKTAPKAAEIKAKAPKKEAAPKAAELKAKKKAKDEAIKEKLQKYIGAEIGDTITMSRPVGYASAGVEYEVLGITSSGIQVQNTATGSRTILSPNELAAGERANTIYSVDKPQVTLPSDPLAETVEQSPAPAGWTDVTGGGNTFAPVTMRDRFGTDNKKEIIEKHFNIEGVPLYQYSKKLGKLPLAGSTEFANRLMERINSIAGGVKVYELTSQQMRDIESSGSIGFYNNKHNIIYLDKDFTDGPNLEHLLLHEGVHAAFIQIMNVKPEIRAVVTRIAQEFKMELERISGTSNFYAFRNVDEFLAEALSNWTMRRRLIQAQASANLRSLMKANAKLSIVSHIRSLWDALRTIVSKSLGFKDADTSLFDAIMHVSAELEFAMEGRNPTETSELERNNISFNRMVEQRKLGSPWDSTTSTYATFPLKGFDDYTKAATQLLPERFQPADKVQVRKARMIWAMDSSHLAQSSKYMGGEKFHASTTDVVNLEQQIHTRALELIRDSEPFQLEYTTAEKNNMGPVWDEFAELIESESNSKTNIAEPLKGQKGISKNALIDVWPKAQHAKLHPRWKAFAAAHPDLAKLRTHALAHFKKAQEQMQYGVLKNRMAAIGVVDDVLMTKLFKKEEELTSEEIKRLGGKRTVNLLQRSPLTSYKGPYYPQFRLGEFVTSGKYAVTSPSDAKAIGTDGNVFEYSGKDARKRAMDFTAKQEYPTTVETTWVDPITNETFFEDLDPEGDTVQIRAGPTIEEAEKRFRVRIENSYMKMHDSLKLAQIDAAEAKLDPNFTLDHLEPRKFNMSELPNGGRELMSHEIRDVLDDMQKHPNWDKMTPIQREELKHLFITLSLNTIGNTRIQNRMRPRRRVQGASRNVSKVWTQYIKSTAGYNAKLEIQPQLDDAVGRMRELAGDKTDGANEENFNIRRTIANELERRVTSHRVLAPVTNLNKNIHRIQAFTFHNYLMSPSYVMNGLLQQPMLTMPTLIAEHGYGATFRAIGYATAKLQPHKTMWQGVKATVKAAAGVKDLSSPTKRANYLEDVITRLNTGEKEMLQYVAKNGGVAPDAGLEISNILGAGWGDQLLEKVTNVARTLPQAVETVNRVTTGIAAYKLAIDKGWSQEKAQQHALEIINRTQFNYSNTNMPPFVSKHPIIGQFKKYGIGVYNLYGYNLGKMAHATTGAERLEAIHALALLTASHALFAGAMGVVGWEPARWLVIGANQAGLVDFTWADVEHGMRELAADALGPYAAELLMKGLPRALGIDISGRVGGSSLLTFSEPRDTDDQSLWAYIGDMVAGAPGGTAMETLRGVNEMMHGDFAKGAQKAAPFKILADVIGAARGAVSGKQTAAGYQVFDPTGFMSPDFIAGVLGYQTARHAETSEQRSYFYDAQARASEERNNFLRDWYNASPNKKASVWKDIVEFNRGRAKDEQVTMGDLNNYSKRRKAQKVAKGGVVMTRRNKALWQGLEDTYATQGYFGE